MRVKSLYVFVSIECIDAINKLVHPQRSYVPLSDGSSIRRSNVNESIGFGAEPQRGGLGARPPTRGFGGRAPNAVVCALFYCARHLRKMSQADIDHLLRLLNPRQLSWSAWLWPTDAVSKSHDFCAHLLSRRPREINPYLFSDDWSVEGVDSDYIPATFSHVVVDVKRVPAASPLPLHLLPNADTWIPISKVGAAAAAAAVAVAAVSAPPPPLVAAVPSPQTEIVAAEADDDDAEEMMIEEKDAQRLLNACIREREESLFSALDSDWEVEPVNSESDSTEDSYGPASAIANPFTTPPVIPEGFARPTIIKLIDAIGADHDASIEKETQARYAPVSGGALNGQASERVVDFRPVAVEYETYRVTYSVIESATTATTKTLLVDGSTLAALIRVLAAGVAIPGVTIVDVRSSFDRIPDANNIMNSLSKFSATSPVHIVDFHQRLCATHPNAFELLDVRTFCDSLYRAGVVVRDDMVYVAAEKTVVVSSERFDVEKKKTNPSLQLRGDPDVSVGRSAVWNNKAWNVSSDIFVPIMAASRQGII